MSLDSTCPLGVMRGRLRKGRLSFLPGPGLLPTPETPMVRRRQRTARAIARREKLGFTRRLRWRTPFSAPGPFID